MLICKTWSFFCCFTIYSPEYCLQRFPFQTPNKQTNIFLDIQQFLLTPSGKSVFCVKPQPQNIWIVFNKHNNFYQNLNCTCWCIFQFPIFFSPTYLYIISYLAYSSLASKCTQQLLSLAPILCDGYLWRYIICNYGKSLFSVKPQPWNIWIV